MSLLGPLWLDVAFSKMGVCEIPGPDFSREISEFHDSIALDGTDEDTALCSSFVNWCFEQCSIHGTNSRAARSWLNWGVVLGRPALGCVTVFWRDSRESWKGHVFFYLFEARGMLYGIGGNQGNEVCIEGYPKDRLLGHRWPA